MKTKLTITEALSLENSEKVRVMAAEVIGWKFDKCLCGCKRPMWRFKAEKLGIPRGLVPNYPADHKAARSLLETLTEEEWEVFGMVFGRITESSYQSLRLQQRKRELLATPLQITVAVLVAKGKIEA